MSLPRPRRYFAVVFRFRADDDEAMQVTNGHSLEVTVCKQCGLLVARKLRRRHAATIHGSASPKGD